MDSTLVVVYSLSGTSRRVAELLGSLQGWPLGVVQDARVGSSPGGWVRCTLDSLLQREPPIQYTGPDPRDFRRVVLVAPVWMGRLPGPMRSFVAVHVPVFRDVAAIATLWSSRADTVFAELERMLGHPLALSMAMPRGEVGQGRGMSRLHDFGETLIGHPVGEWTAIAGPPAQTHAPGRALS